MVFIKSVKKKSLIAMACVLAVVIIALCLVELIPPSVAESAQIDSEWYFVLNDFFEARNQSLLGNGFEALKKMYIMTEQNGQWAFETEVKRSKYIQNWSERQGVTFTGIVSKFDIKRVKKVGRGYAFFVVVSTEYRYAYADAPEDVNMFRIGTYHTLDIIPASSEGAWAISREWYKDPFVDSLELNELKTGDINAFITSQPARDFSAIIERRKKAVAYADRYAGAAGDEEHGFRYNSKYRDFTGSGGDCTNFASQVLHEGGGFRKTRSWNYAGGELTRAWGKASGFKDYLIYSGRGSLIARGSYNQVYKSAYKLLPGDIISYERKGKIVHTSIVTGADSKGYPMVNSHTTDRYHVPWDLGWNDDKIRFWLIRVHY